MRIKKSTEKKFVFFMSDATDNETGETGLTPTITVSKDGGAFASATNSAAEIANGWYSITLTTAETNTVGPIILKATGSGANDWLDIHDVYEDALTDVEVNRIIDMLYRRSLANVEASSDGEALDTDSLLGAILTTLNSSVSGSTLTINKTDTTALGTLTLTVDGNGDWTGKTL